MSEVFILALMLILAVTVIASAVVSALALLQAQRTHILINSRMDQLIRLTEKNAREEGIIAGILEEKEREKLAHDIV